MTSSRSSEIEPSSAIPSPISSSISWGHTHMQLGMNCIEIAGRGVQKFNWGSNHPSTSSFPEGIASWQLLLLAFLKQAQLTGVTMMVADMLEDWILVSWKEFFLEETKEKLNLLEGFPLHGTYRRGLFITCLLGALFLLPPSLPSFQSLFTPRQPIFLSVGIMGTHHYIRI